MVRLLWQLGGAAGCWGVVRRSLGFSGDVRVAARSRDNVSELVAALGVDEDFVGEIFQEG